MSISTVNKAVSVPNEYELYDLDRQFIRKVVIETPQYEVVQLALIEGKYYIGRGGWRLVEAPLTEVKP